MAARYYYSPKPYSGRAKNGQPSQLSRFLHVFFSPLARRMIIINVIGVGVLVSGIFYLNQYRYKFMGANRVETLTTQAQIIAVAIAQTSKTNSDAVAESAKAADENKLVVPSGLIQSRVVLPGLFWEVVSPILHDLIAPTKTRARVFDTDGTLISDSRRRHFRRRNRSRVDGRGGGNFFSDLWAYLRAAFWTPDLPLYIDLGPEGKAYEEVRVALAGSVAPLIRVTEAGETVLSIAVPIQRERATLGALLLTAQGSDIDEMLAQDRLQIVEVAALVVFATVILTWSSARTVTETMRRIAVAAERVGKNTENRE